MLASHHVTEERRAAYERDGCVRIPGVFAAETVGSLLAGLDRLLAAHHDGALPPAIAGTAAQPEPIILEGHGGTRILHALPRVPELVAWLHDSPAAELVGRMTGASSVRFWLDASFIKEGGAPEAATPWHIDESTFGLNGAQLPSLWIALTDVDADNAPLTTIRGSHATPWRYQSQFAPAGVPLPDGFKSLAEMRALVADSADKVQVWTAKAGDVLLIHPKTIHGSLPRKPGLPGRRVAFTSRWIGSDARWMPNAYSYPMALKDGGAPLVEGEPPPEDSYPVLWQDSPSCDIM